MKLACCLFLLKLLKPSYRTLYRQSSKLLVNNGMHIQGRLFVGFADPELTTRPKCHTISYLSAQTWNNLKMKINDIKNVKKCILLLEPEPIIFFPAVEGDKNISCSATMKFGMTTL